MIAATSARFGQLDLLVNNAGATKRGDFLALPASGRADGYALKLFEAMRCCRTAWSRSQATRGNIVGVGARTASAELRIGGSVNAALLSLTRR